MAAATAELEKPAASLGEPKNNPTTETPAKAITTADVEKQLLGLLGGNEAAEAEEPGEEQQPGADATAEQPAAEEEGEETPTLEVPEEEAESDDEAEPEGKQQWPETAQKRVDKLTAQRAEAREQATQLQTEKDTLEQQLAEAQQALEQQQNAGRATQEDPLGFIGTPKALAEYTTSVRQHLRLIEDHFDGVLKDADRSRLEKWASENGAFDKEDGAFNDGQLRMLKRTAQDALTEYVPARERYLIQEAQASQFAEQQFPWLKNRQSPEYGVYQQVLQAIPEVKKVPHWKAVAAVYVRGLQAVQADQKKGVKPGAASAKTPAKAAPPKLPGKPNVVPQRPANNGDGVETLRNKALQSKNPKDWENLLAAQLNAMAA